MDKRQPNISMYSTMYLHRVCCSVNNRRSAAILLGVRDHVLIRYLAHWSTCDATGREVALTFNTFRTLSPELVAGLKVQNRTKNTNMLPCQERYNLTPAIIENTTDLPYIDSPAVLPPEIMIENESVIEGDLVEEIPSAISKKRKTSPMGNQLNFNRKKILSMFSTTLENIKNFDFSPKADDDQTNIEENLDSEDSMSNFFNIS